MMRTFFIVGTILGGLAVAFGAFGAHGLKNIVTPERLDTFETAVRYQMYHALALLAIAWAISQWPEQAKLLAVAGWLMLAGVFLFSGSLYALVLSRINWLGAITPLGGVAFIAGWLCALVAIWKSS